MCWGYLLLATVKNFFNGLKMQNGLKCIWNVLQLLICHSFKYAWDGCFKCISCTMCYCNKIKQSETALISQAEISRKPSVFVNVCGWLWHGLILVFRWILSHRVQPEVKTVTLRTAAREQRVSLSVLSSYKTAISLQFSNCVFALFLIWPILYSLREY